jgi:hypothetical protein
VIFDYLRASEFSTGFRQVELSKEGDRAFRQQARTSMVDGFPYKEEVGGSNPSVPTSCEISDLKSEISDMN